MIKSDFEKLADKIFEGKFTFVDLPATLTDKTPIRVVCPTHGERTVGRDNFLKSEFGCRKCRKFTKITSPEEKLDNFLKLAIAKHGDKFDYSRVVIVNNLKDMVIIGCKACGTYFEQRASSHCSGTGCGYCSGRHRDLSSFIKLVPLDKAAEYDFSNAKYRGTDEPMEVKCPKHNHIYWATPNGILHNLSGCPSCSLERKRLNKTTLDLPVDNIGDYYKQKFNLVHQGKYDYSLADFSGQNNKDRIKIICPQHGIFEKRIDGHGYGEGCPECRVLSSTQAQLLEYVKSLVDEVTSNKSLPSRKQIDIFVPSKGIGFEFNGLHWHSENRLGKEYHLEKLKEANKEGIRLIQIFEDEWLEKAEIVKSRIKSMLGADTRLFARKTELKEISWAETLPFLNRHHIQGAGSPTGVNLGLFDKRDSSLVAVMTFSQSRFEEGEITELVRYCSKGTIVGGFSKLLTHFIKTKSFISLVSYADLRWSSGGVYLNNGFKLVNQSAPGYFWCKSQKRYNRMAFQKHKLRSILKVFNPELTEKENCEANGYFRVFDCGQLKFEYIK